MGRSSTFVYLCFKDVDGVIWYDWILKRSSVQFSLSVVSDSLWPHGLQHARFPCLSPTPRAYSNSCPLSQWCHPTTSSSVVPFSSHLQSFPASGSFPMSQFFLSGGQSIGISALASVLPKNIQDWFPLLIFLPAILIPSCASSSLVFLMMYSAYIHLQARLQQYVNRELPDVQAGFRKGRGTRDQIANICWIIEKARKFQKNIHFCFIDYAKAFDCVDHNKLIVYQGLFYPVLFTTMK